MSTMTTTIDVQVTPSSDPQQPYTWEFSLNGGSFQSLNGASVFTTPAGTENDVTMNIAAGPTGDTCVFQNPDITGQTSPLTIYKDWRLAPSGTFTPQWLQGDEPVNSENNATITFTDDNTNVWDRIYHFVINAVYTNNSVNPPVTQNTTSPDPTIMNVGTDGGVVIDPALVSRAQPQPASQA